MTSPLSTRRARTTLADALSRIEETCLSDKEADKVLKAVPMIPGDDTIFEVFEEKEEDQQPEKATLHTMSPETMKAVFGNLTSRADRKAELEYKDDSATHREADSIEVSIWSMRQSTQMHITDWAEAQCEDPEIKAAMDWCHLNRRKSQPWTEQLTKLKFRLGTRKNTPKGEYIKEH